jgi:hypothetical protein
MRLIGALSITSLGKENTNFRSSRCNCTHSE